LNLYRKKKKGGRNISGPKNEGGYTCQKGKKEKRRVFYVGGKKQGGGRKSIRTYPTHKWEGEGGKSPFSKKGGGEGQI